MASVKILLRKEKVNKKGMAPLYILIIKNRKKKYISLGQLISVKHWNEKDHLVKGGKNGNPNAQWLNNFISSKLSSANQVALDMETKNAYQFNTGKVKEKITGKNSENLFNYAYEIIERFKRSGKYGTYRHQKSVIDKLKSYVGSDNFLFDDADLHFLKNYERHLRIDLENSANTIHKNFKTLRKFFNQAAKEDIYPFEKNPFLRFTLKTEPTFKKFLNEPEIRMIENLNLSETTLKLHRDLFIFALYAGGLRISDVLKLKWENFDGERIILKIQKSGQTHTIKLPHKAIEIIRDYTPENPDKFEYIFPVLPLGAEKNPQQLYNAISGATAMINKNLKRIAVMVGIDSTKFSFHISRHTFATQALKKGIRIEYVSKLLGHSDIRTTQIYTKIVNTELEKAMEVFND